ncbi:hypothetical protein O1611_g5413 [Lasiodiplodia mahajangana]|uniref:Uncharacterized protein n=1 Tax=Lasiodiplodia mahajangana TaxID=1108764 RepID=A0ACC2JL51_9PEZI|nr:hypothetical protein O1611_g5413 [Lasiodiplodia mahajangana]
MNDTSDISTLIGGLTTIYTPPATGCDGSIGTDLELTGCFPRAYDRDARYFYSPGMCPSGYHVACTNYGVDGGITTTATCCPSGYTCHSDPPVGNIFACSSLFRAEVPTIALPSVFYETTVVSTNGDYKTEYPIAVETITTAITPGNSIRCYGVIVVRQPNDPDFTTTTDPSSTTIGPRSTTADPSSTTIDPISTTTDSNTPNSGGLSLGGKINLGDFEIPAE